VSPADRPAQRRNVLAGVALGVACAGLPFAFIPVAFVLSVPLGAIGLVLALLGRSAARRPALDGRGQDMATAALAAAVFVLVVGLLGAAAVWNASRLPDPPRGPTATEPR
jgi:hypothetical protein